MKTETTEDIKTFEPFVRLVQPLSEKEAEALPAELQTGTSNPVIHIWNGYHLTDQAVYEICRKEKIAFQTEELSFDSWMQAAIFICSAQLSGNSLTPEYRKYLIGQEFQYMLLGTDDASPPETKYQVADPIAKELKISNGTVLKYNSYSVAINDLYDTNPEFAKRILLGKIRISHENVVEISRLMTEEKRAIAELIVTDNIDHVSLSFIRSEAKWSHIKKQAPVSRRERKELSISKQAGIQQMPEYNPDAEANSLCMTIDSWISSIQRVKNSDSFGKITNKASLQLMKKLSFLEHTINTLQESLVERKENE